MLDGIGKVVHVSGPAGADGASVFQTWLANGNTGTEAEFLAGLKGTDGRDGKDGAGTLLVRTTAAFLPRDSNVVDAGNGTVVPADPSNPAHCGRLLGLVRGVASPGALVEVITLGPIAGVTGTFSDGERLWIAADGTCTRTPPASGWRQCLGLGGADGAVAYKPERAELYDPSTSLVLVPTGNPAAAMAILGPIFDALPWVPADLSTVPAGGAYYREGDAGGWRLVKLVPAT